ncbi:hypothetical protein DPMN_027885 [Dreissena polymorpha]|uniref:Uncharacterized protein n=1 Tax=Dreissena polymorpha TaxID=45954 RepID=A0A9D4RFY2_DREPO|nr:hypothetical protein DPMN_027885 [Dreissena polymorpha]
MLRYTPEKVQRYASHSRLHLLRGPSILRSHGYRMMRQRCIANGLHVRTQDVSTILRVYDPVGKLLVRNDLWSYMRGSRGV